MTATMRAAVLAEFGGALRLESRPIPEPGPGQVQVQVIACGAGLTLEWARLGRLGGSTPRIMGHEYSGRVAAVGPGVAQWKEGDAVTGTFYLICGNCPMCSGGRETLCPNFRGYIGVAVDGAFAEYVVVPALNLVAIPEGVPLREAGIIADAIATPYHVATERAHIAPGKSVAIIGAGGGVGVHMAEVARAFGGAVVAVDRDASKLARLRSMGYETVDASSDSWTDEVIEATGGGADVVVDMVASAQTLSGGLSCLGVAGTFVTVGFEPGVTLPVEPAQLILKEVVVTGVRYASRAQIAASLELVRSGAVRCVAETSFPLEKVEDAMAAIAHSEVFGRVLIDCDDAV
jgi:propanol-preferring alcohol dehydrogenase